MMNKFFSDLTCFGGTLFPSTHITMLSIQNNFETNQFLSGLPPVSTHREVAIWIWTLWYLSAEPNAQTILH